MKPEAFFFDLDGTLVDTERLWARAIVACLKDRGCEAEEDATLNLILGHSWLDIHAKIHAAHPELGTTSAAEDAKALRAYYDRICTDPATTVIPSAVAFYRKAARIAPCAIVSGSPHPDVEAAARTCGIELVTKFVLGAEDYARGKPAPDGFLKAAAMLDVDASECVAVEDSAAGIAAARAAGMRVIGVDRVGRGLAGCTWLVSDLSEIDPIAEFSE